MNMKVFNQYELYEFLFRYYNDKLFNNELDLSFISISRKKGFVSFFLPENEGGAEEIEKWKSKEPHIAFVHEMIHVYQEKKETSSPNYHNKDYAQISENIGLPTISIGKPAGKRTGRKIKQTDTWDGMFFLAYNEVILCDIIFQPIPVVEKTTAINKQIRDKCHCPNCGKKHRDMKDGEALCLVCLKAYDEDAYNRLLKKYSNFVFREIEQSK